MFAFKQEKNNLLVVTLSGKVTAGEVTAFYDQFTPAIEAAEQVGLVIDLSGFDDMTAEAIRRDIPMELALLDQMGKLPKAAIITDKEFIGAAVEAVNPLIPMIDMRVFAPDQRQAAIAFASDLPEKKPQGRGARLIASPSPKVVAFEIDGYVDDEEMLVISKELNSRIDRGETFNALGRLVSFRGLDPKILTEGSFFKMKFGSLKALGKYALVSDETWIKPLIGFAKSATGIDMRHFTLSEEQAAWDWVTA